MQLNIFATEKLVLMWKMAIAYIFIVLYTGLFANGQEGYRIRFEIEGLPDTVCYLVNYYGDKTYITDSANVETGGIVVFQGDSALPAGIYILAGQTNNRILEFIGGADHEVTFISAYEKLPMIDKIQGSDENMFFFDYIEFSSAKMSEIEKLRKKKKEIQNAETIATLDEEIDSLNTAVGKYKTDFIDAHPDAFVASVFSAMKEPDIEAAKKSDSPYRFLVDHYWDDFDLTDERLLRTPLYHRKLNDFFGKVVYQHPDSIIAEADRLIDKVTMNRDMFKYTVWFLTFKYETSNIMGFDEIFVHMAERYYGTGEAFWADSSVVAAMVKRAKQLRPILLGEKAPELILTDTSGNFVSLHRVQADYTLVFFYEPDCGHCKTETDKIKEWYDNDTLGLAVFAVCTDTSLAAWKKYIVDRKLDWIHVNGTRSITADYHDLYNISMTPTLFLLDRNKRIIAKRLKTDQLRPFLEDYYRKGQIKQD